jgi:hypothetical protein
MLLRPEIYKIVIVGLNYTIKKKVLRGRFKILKKPNISDGMDIPG